MYGYVARYCSHPQTWIMPFSERVYRMPLVSSTDNCASESTMIKIENSNV